MRPFLIVAFHFFSILAEASSLFTLDPDALTDVNEGIRGLLSWEKDSGRYDGACLKVSPPSLGEKVRFEVFSKPRPLLAPDRYRCEVWLKSEVGEVRIDLVLSDWESGTEVARHTLDSSKQDPNILSSLRTHGWEYHACDIPLEEDERLLGYNLEIDVPHGPVWIDGLQLVGADSLIANGDFVDIEAIPGQGGAASTTPRGWRRSFSGSGEFEAEGAYSVQSREGANSLVLQKLLGEFVLSAEPILVPSDVRRLVGRVIVENSTQPLPTLRVRQFGRGGLLREDSSTRAVPFDKQTVLSTHPIATEPGAERILCSLEFPGQAGAYTVRTASLIPLSPPNPNPQILFDQVGYESGEPLRFVVASRVYPASGAMSFALSNEGIQTIGGFLRPLGRAVGEQASDWGNYYFEGAIQNPSPGAYHLEVTLGDRTAEVDGVSVGERRHFRETAELAYRFFYYQRCGCEVPGWHGPCHLDDAKLPDGTLVDLRGGYHNAGDYHKHMGDNTPVAVYAMISTYERSKSFFDDLDRDGNGRADLLDEVFWGSDWLLKMVDPGTGRFWMNVTNDIDYYGIPERDTDGKKGNGDDRLVGVDDPIDLGAYAMAAWAVLSRCAPEPEYLEAAERSWLVYESRILDSYEPRLLIAALELYRTTQKEAYRSACDKIARNLLAIQDSGGWFAGAPGGGRVFRIVDEGTIPAALALYVLEWPNAEFAAAIRHALRRYYSVILGTADNPFGVLRHYSDSEPFYFKKREDWFGGSNSAYLSLAWSASLASRVFAQDQDFCLQLERLAADQLHWLLGMNPLDLCMFEGKGNSERIRFHHLYAAIPGHSRGAVPGAIPNGIVREPGNSDRPWFDIRTGQGAPPGAESAEPWLPHNAYYLLAISS